jgi:hypothetical protein
VARAARFSCTADATRESLHSARLRGWTAWRVGQPRHARGDSDEPLVIDHRQAADALGRHHRGSLGDRDSAAPRDRSFSGAFVITWLTHMTVFITTSRGEGHAALSL